MATYNISGLPDDIPPGEYDVTLDRARFTVTRAGESELVFETTFRGPHNPDDPTLLHFTKQTDTRTHAHTHTRTHAHTHRGAQGEQQ